VRPRGHRFFQTQGLIPNASAASYPDPTIGLRYWQGDFFFSDQFKPRPNVTLTLGFDMS
jgi:hypothetical protein